MERYCWNCGNYRPYYEKGFCNFTKTEHGFCSKKLQVAEKHGTCEFYRTRPHPALILRVILNPPPERIALGRWVKNPEHENSDYVLRDPSGFALGMTRGTSTRSLPSPLIRSPLCPPRLRLAPLIRAKNP